MRQIVLNAVLLLAASIAIGVVVGLICADAGYAHAPVIGTAAASGTAAILALMKS